jgi:hypothetical protein
MALQMLGLAISFLMMVVVVIIATSLELELVGNCNRISGGGVTRHVLLPTFRTLCTVVFLTILKSDSLSQFTVCAWQPSVMIGPLFGSNKVATLFVMASIFFPTLMVVTFSHPLTQYLPF